MSDSKPQPGSPPPRDDMDPVELLRRNFESIRRDEDSLDGIQAQRLVDSLVIRYPSRSAELRQILAEYLPNLENTLSVRSDTLNPKIDDLKQGGEEENLPDDAPRSLGRYLIRREIGRGGMGIVYLAHDPQLRRPVAIKMLPPALAKDAKLVTRFQREAAAATELAHPAIVPIYEVGTDEDFHFFVMRFVDGEALRAFARRVLKPKETNTKTGAATASTSKLRGAIGLIRTTARLRAKVTISLEGLAAILRIAEQTARALAHAHDQGIIHRDVKPANIMVDRQGSAQLLDFGLAKMSTQESMTQSGLLIGTVAYMAPEQIAKSQGTVDHRTDIYALGVSLYECLTGTRPFVDNNAQALIYQALHKEAPSPIIHVPELSRDVETIISKCLEKKQARRYQSATELAEDLASVRAHERIDASPVGRVGRLVRWSEHNKAASLLGLFILLIVIGIGIVSLQQHFVAAQEKKSKTRTQVVAARLAMKAHSAKRQELKNLSIALLAAEKTTPEHLPADHERKLTLLSIRAKRRAIMQELDGLRQQARFATARAFEINGSIIKELEQERQDFLFSLYLAAEDERNEIKKTALRELLADGPHADALVGQGQLSLDVWPEGSHVSVYRYEPDARGVLVASKQPVFAGPAPLRSLTLAVGSYLAVVEKESFNPARYPILIERDQHWGNRNWHHGKFAEKNWGVQLKPKASYDSDHWALIPPGPYLSTADRDHYGLQPTLEWRWLNAFLIEKQETQWQRYQPFLSHPQTYKEILASYQKSKSILMPRMANGAPRQDLITLVGRGAEARFKIHAEHAQAVINSVSQWDARKFTTWLSQTEEYGYSLPSGEQWEKAARGVDGRLFPWGNVFDRAYVHGPSAATNFKIPLATPGTKKEDCSPYDLVDIAGNVREWCQEGRSLHEEYDNPYLCGGDCSDKSTTAEAFTLWPRTFLAWDNLGATWGFRLVRSLERKQ